MADIGDPDQIARFFQKVSRNPKTLCWEWTGSTCEWGYGRVTINNQLIKAHRAAHLMFLGDLEDGQIVRHKCDNPCCVNPAHLISGTHADNARDKAVRGRAKTKVSEKQVRQIRAAKGTCRDIGEEFGISPASVSLIKRSLRRQHIGG